MANIARATGLTQFEVRTILVNQLIGDTRLNDFLDCEGPVAKKVMKRFRDDEMRRQVFLHATRPKTLRQMAHLSLDERAKVLSRKFHNIGLKAWHLRKEFRRQKIRFKSCVSQKNPKIRDVDELQQQFTAVRTQLQRARDEGRRIVYTDEAVFSKNVQRKLAFSEQYSNIAIDQDLMKAKTFYVVAAISLERGVESLRVFDGPIDSSRYCSILPQLRRNGGNFALFGDQVSYHNSRQSVENYQKFDTFFIKNLAYMPRLNPIEMYFNILKKRYRKLWLESMMRNQPLNIPRLVQQARNQQGTRSVQQICQAGKKAWEQESLLKALTVTRNGQLEIRQSSWIPKQLIKLKVDGRMANPFDQKAITTLTEAQAIQQLKQKFGGKRPLYDFLQIGCQKYLPPYDQCSCTFMLDVIAGRKLALNTKDIIDLKVPCFSEFSHESLMGEVRTDALIMKYLPDLENKKKRHSRKFLINVVSTLKPMFMEKLLERSNAERAVSEGIPKNSQQLQVCPEFQNLLANVVFQPTIETEGLKLALLMRMCPLIPFNVQNYLMGATSIRLQDYALGGIAMYPWIVTFLFFGTTVSDIQDAVNGSFDQSKLVLAGLVTAAILMLIILLIVSHSVRKQLKKMLETQDDSQTRQSAVSLKYRQEGTELRTMDSESIEYDFDERRQTDINDA